MNNQPWLGPDEHPEESIEEVLARLEREAKFNPRDRVCLVSQLNGQPYKLLAQTSGIEWRRAVRIEVPQRAGMEYGIRLEKPKHDDKPMYLTDDDYTTWTYEHELALLDTPTT